MTFIDFLNWLFSRILKILDWFGAEYWILRNAAASAFQWAKDWGAWAYRTTVAWAQGELSRLSVWFGSLLASLENRLGNWIQSVKSYAIDLYNRVIAYFTGIIDAVKAWASALYHAAIAFATAGIESLKSVLVTFVKGLVEQVVKLFSPLLALSPFVSFLVSLADPNNRSKLLQLLNVFYHALTTFFGNPLGFILGILWGRFVEYLCYALGYGLGSTEATLPPIPAWGGVGISPPGTQPPPIPPGTGPLTRPVSPLYITGYTFGSGHYGTDFGLTNGQTVYAAHDGKVTFAGWDSVGYGQRVDISGDPWWSRYGHNLQVLVSVGQEVHAGDAISYGDSTGNSTGPHLHFELKLNGAYVDPVGYL